MNKYEGSIQKLKSMHPKIDNVTAAKILELLAAEVETAYRTGREEYRTPSTAKRSSSYLLGMHKDNPNEDAVIASLYAKEHGFKR